MPDGNEAAEAIISAQEDVGEEGESDIDKILADLAWYDYAQKMGIDISPTTGEMKELLQAILEEGVGISGAFADDIAAIDQQIAEIGEFGPRTSHLLQQKQALLSQQQQEGLDFMERYGPHLDALRSAFAKSGAAERPGDPLNTYFEAVDRLFAEALGPSPASRFRLAPGPREAFQTTTPTDFQQLLISQEEELQQLYLAEVFEQFGPQVREFADQLAGLPSDARFRRFIQMRSQLGLDIPSFEEFLASEQPRLAARFKFTQPLADEEQAAAFRSVFREFIGEEGGELTEFGMFATRSQQALAQEFEDITRERLRAGEPLEGLETFEQFLGGQLPELQRTFKIMQPLADVDTEQIFRDIFGRELGVGGGQITPFGIFAQRQQADLEQRFADLARDILREGGAIQDVPAFETFLQAREPELERTFALTSPGLTGRRIPGRLARPTRKI